jgi:hypothetical protein
MFGVIKQAHAAVPAGRVAMSKGALTIKMPGLEVVLAALRPVAAALTC